MIEVRVIQLPGGQLQVFVDGDLDFADAERITRQLIDELGARIPGGVQLTSKVESHKAGNVRHAHVVGEVKGHGH